MTPEQDQGERLRAALARTVDAHTPSPAPVGRILAAGRAHRARRRRAAVVASAAAVRAAGLTALPLTGHGGVRPADRPGRPVAHPSHSDASDRDTPGHALVKAVVGHGTVDGTPWSVTLEFHPTLPAGFSAGSPPPGMAQPRNRTSLLCQRMVIDGVRVDHSGGPWSDCQPVDGTHDPSAGGEVGLWGLHDKGAVGSRLVVGNPEAAVTHATVTLSDGERLTASTVAVPGTVYRAWAVAIPADRSIASVDEFDAGDHRVGHDTQFR